MPECKIVQLKGLLTHMPWTRWVCAGAVGGVMCILSAPVSSCGFSSLQKGETGPAPANLISCLSNLYFLIFP